MTMKDLCDKVDVMAFWGTCKWVGGVGVIAGVLGLLVGWPTSVEASARKTMDQAGRMEMGVTANYAQLPLVFEMNQGQVDARVKFLSRGSGYGLYLAPTEAVLVLRQDQGTERPAFDDEGAQRPDRGAGRSSSASIRMRMIGANPSPEVSGVDEMVGKVNYLVGREPRKWHTHIPTYAQVRYRGVYPGIDLVYYGRQQHLEYDFIVAPQVDPHVITLGFEGLQGLSVDPKTGDLVLTVNDGEIRMAKPYVYQENQGIKQPIAGAYVVKGKRQVGFQVAEYDHGRPLVIDPVLAFSTFLGGSLGDEAHSVVLDSESNVYMIGGVSSTNFPMMNAAFGTNTGGFDAFVTKMDPTGTILLYSTYLGGSNDEFGYGIALDASNNVYVSGLTSSTDFPVTTGGIQPSFGGGLSDAFVAKLDATGSTLLYATYLGGGDKDQGRDLTVGLDGYVYIVGRTASSNFPTHNPLLPARQGSTDGFVVKLDMVNSVFVYATYLGGLGIDLARGVEVDPSGNAYVTGLMGSNNFPTTAGAFMESAPGMLGEAFVSKLNPDGSAFVYSTLLGGSKNDRGFDIALDIAGNAYITGRTESLDFPLVNPIQSVFGGGFLDGFSAKLSADGSTLLYSTYLGGSGDDEGHSIVADAAGQAYVAGTTDSPDFPTINAVQPTLGGSMDMFVAKLDALGAPMHYSTYLGGSDTETKLIYVRHAVAVNAEGGAYVVGVTESADFPTTIGAFQPAFGGGVSDAFLVKIEDDSPPPQFADISVSGVATPDPVTIGEVLTYTMMVSNMGLAMATDTMLTSILPVGTTFVSATPSQGSCNEATGTVVCGLSDIASNTSVTVTVVVTPTLAGVITNAVVVTSSAAEASLANNAVNIETMVNGVADEITITWAVWNSAKLSLSVKATSSAAPTAVLTVVGFGDMVYDSVSNVYTRSFKNVLSNPGSVTVTSSMGGSATATVP